MTDFYLGELDGKPVARTTVAITRAGDGLSEALGIEPRVLHLGERVTVVLDCVVSKVRFDPLKETDSMLSRVHVLQAGTAVIADSETVQGLIREQADKNRRAREAEQGIRRLPFADELAEQHDAGHHASALIPGCPQCDAEAAAVEVDGRQSAPVPVAELADRRKR